MGDLRDWNEDQYRDAIVRERRNQSLTLFRAIFPPSQGSSDPDFLLVATSDGSLASYSLPSAISRYSARSNGSGCLDGEFIALEPHSFVKAHNGPVYDVKFFGDDEGALLLSCGDDGHIRGWHWSKLLDRECEMSSSVQECHLTPSVDLMNPQHKGPWNAFSPIPEINSIATDVQGGRVFGATGDSCAYCWDLETGRRIMTLGGHSDYLHCIVYRRSTNQIITGSEDGTAQLWDCRSGKCTQVLCPRGFHETNITNRAFSWISSLAMDATESWLVCGGGDSLSLWSLPASACVSRFETHFPIQDVIFDNNQILAVGANPLLRRFNIDGKILSQIQCAPQSAFSVSLNSSGVLTKLYLAKPLRGLSSFNCRSRDPFGEFRKEALIVYSGVRELSQLLEVMEDWLISFQNLGVTCALFAVYSDNGELTSHLYIADFQNFIAPDVMDRQSHENMDTLSSCRVAA